MLRAPLCKYQPSGVQRAIWLALQRVVVLAQKRRPEQGLKLPSPGAPSGILSFAKIGRMGTFRTMRVVPKRAGAAGGAAIDADVAWREVGGVAHGIFLPISAAARTMARRTAL